jgi:4-amino-4-deoxy-L-arabinose transferase-like glycosyltransferase
MTRAAYVAVSALLVLLVIALRLEWISENSITQDESTMILFAKGVLERGYPFLRQATSEFVISTYEIVPYPIAASMALFGDSEVGVRIPAVLFASGTALLILHFGRTLFDWRVGVLAALLFAVLPWAIYWGANAFYPSQVQFFSLLTTMVIHRIIREERPKTWVYYAMFGAFSSSYLSWEGSGFLLPVLFVLIVTFRWGKWQWMTDVHGWIAASLMILLVVGQLTYRTVLREPYVGIITGRSEVSAASLAFTSISYDPYFYINGLSSEAHVVIAWCLVAGIFLLHRSRNLFFLYVFVASIVLFLTAFLGYYALRYVYLALPALLLAASAVSISVVDLLTEKLHPRLLLRGASMPPAAAATAPTPSKFRVFGVIGVTALHLSVATPWGLKPLGIDESLSGSRPYELRQDLAGFPFRAASLALKERVREGDIVIVQAPFPFEVYTEMRGDYFLQSVIASSIFYDAQTRPYYTDKWIGNPVLRSQAELEEVLLKHDRVWLVSAPDGASRLSIGNDIYDWFAKRADVVVETADGRLFLWERPGRT